VIGGVYDDVINDDDITTAGRQGMLVAEAEGMTKFMFEVGSVDGDN
jgi:hypothetical protein